MPCGICSVPFLVRCTRRLIHVVPIMFYHLACCGLLILSLMGLVVCSFSQIPQIYACKLIGGMNFFGGADSDLLLLAVVICPTV